MNRGSGGFGGGGGFPALSPMVKKLMIANGVFWVLQLLMLGTGVPFTEIGSISVAGVFRGMIWQPFTYMWLHDIHGPMHLLFNMFALYMFGGSLEAVWGAKRFLRFYLICGVGAGFIIMAGNLLSGAHYVTTLGASGAIYGLLTAFSLTWPDRTIMLLFPPIPIKAIWFIPVLFVMQLAMGGGGNVSHVGHLGGVIVAAIVMRSEVKGYFGFSKLRYRWHRYRMRNRLKAVRRDEWERRKNQKDDDDPTYH